MDTWLNENRQQYQMFLSVTQLLLERGFSPLATEPYHDDAFRTDHTEAVMTLLRSFAPDSVSWPLKVFSTGPLFRPGRSWSDAIDVEWVGPTGLPEEHEMVTLIGEMAHRFLQQGMESKDLTMVFGHLGWLRGLARCLKLPDSDVENLVRELRQGRLTSVDQILGRAGTPEARQLFQPQSPAAFFSRLAAWIPGSDYQLETARWNTIWDLSLTGQRSYYTGIVFSLYHRAIGQPLVNGGKFQIAGDGMPAGGIGFTMYLDACRAALGDFNLAL